MVVCDVSPVAASNQNIFSQCTLLVGLAKCRRICKKAKVSSCTNCFILSLSQNAVVESKGTAGVLLDKGAEKSPTKARQPRKVDLRARYWAFLFDNLRRAVDEIYVTCESDQSVVECKVSCVKYLCPVEMHILVMGSVDC